MITQRVTNILQHGRDVLIVTGAGISAESGIPTFRGPGGYWTVGSEVYRPEDLATRAAFERMPEEIWRWYLYRRGVCGIAEPNEAHRAVARLEHKLGERFLLVTQNVDGLHLRAGSSASRTLQIHGNLGYARCMRCGTPPEALPEHVRIADQREPLTPAHAAALRCPRCGGWTRPHVLWFDESYDEPLFRAESAARAAERAGLVITVGSSGGTNLPMHLAATAAARGAVLVDVNPDPNPFAELAERSGGLHLRAPASAAVPELVEHLAGHLPSP
jgi:NAD-dependent deacetylase